jgi:hypothetical protein
MSNRLFAAARVIRCFGLVAAVFILAYSQSTSSTPDSTRRDSPMTRHAAGTFEVKTTPLDPAFKTEDNSLGRMSIDKQFHGNLDAASKGEMLTAGSAVKGSGAYVAIERVSGTLPGRSGTFILQHSGTMSHGAFQLDIKVVPDSGTGRLAGLSRSMNIILKDGKHSYDLAYTLPESKWFRFPFCL